MASLATFLTAFVLSVVLSFADIGDNVTVSSLMLGLLFGWLPVLVIFAIVDRNPVSSLRSSELMSRWLYNVDAVRTHFHSSNHNLIPVHTEQQKPETPTEAPIQNPQTQSKPRGIQWWTTNVPRVGQTIPQGRAPPFHIGEFIGQGRRMQYCGLVAEVLEKAEKIHFDRTITRYDDCAAEVITRLRGRRPAQWYAVAGVSLFLVWSQVLMAIMIAYNTPTVGFGCWSAGYLLFGVLSSVSWAVHLCSKKPGRSLRIFCYVFNFLAFCWLISLTVLVLIGSFNNCACLTNFGAYMNFENAKFYLEYCNVQKYWIGATILGGLVHFFAFLAAMIGWLSCQPLWTVNESGPPEIETRDMGEMGEVKGMQETREVQETKIDWTWLRYTVA